MIGKTLSHYKVLEKIGQGGMGEVYRAEDTNLSREVAIKVLPEQFTKDPQRLARFEREAKLLASLNHPNIAAIYGLEEADGVRFLALELVPGETLQERVAKGPLPVEEALEVCRQIAEGVEAAHEKGVIHRDLKPANVKVTPEGKVKILDFGLAKAFEAEPPVTDISQSPTLTEEMTRAGVILGTAAYMSPEQAKGKPVDKRADVFAFGAVLYELLTGKRAFAGETITETIAKVLESEPDWEVLPQDTPWTIRNLLRRCLTKDPHDRLRDIANVRVEIKLALTEPTTVSPTGVVSAAQPTRRLWAMTVGLVVGAVVAGLAVWLLIQPSSPLQSLNKFVITPLPPARLTATTGREVTISPDGKHLVYLANVQGETNQLYLRSLNDFVDRPIPGTENAFPAMFFSPDSESVAFYAGGSLKKISLTGSSAITLCQAPSIWPSGTWGPDNTIVFTRNNSLHRVSANGGEPELLLALNRDQRETAHAWPQFLPGGENLLFTVVEANGARYHLKMMSLATGEQRMVLENARQAQYLTTGHLVYEQAGTGNLMAVPFDPTRIEVTGDPVPVVQQVRSTLSGYVDFTISENGNLVYVPGSGSAEHNHRLVWVDRDGKETLVTQEEKDYRVPRISPDGKLISLSVGAVINQVWIYDLEAESLSRLTFEEERSGSSVWSPDSKWLIFQSGEVGEGGLVRQPADRSLPQERLTSTRETGGRQMPNSWSSDGKFLAINVGSSPLTGTFDIMILPLEGDGEPEYIVASNALECCPKFSPDGKWLAYVTNETGNLQVYVRPFPGPEGEVKWMISEEGMGGGQPVWSPDGRELFYRSGDRTMVVSIQTQGQTLTAGSPKVLFEGSYVSHSVPTGFQYYDISPDGKRFLMLKEVTPETTQINVVLNWFEELKRLVPTN